jgi:hypothetical protein
MPLTYINHDGSLSNEQLELIGSEFNQINSDLTGLGMDEMFFFTTKYETPCKAEPLEVFIRLSERLTESVGGRAKYADLVRDKLIDFKKNNNLSININLTVETPNWDIRVGI